MLIFLRISYFSISFAILLKLFFRNIYYLEANNNLFCSDLLNYFNIQPLPIDNLKIKNKDFKEYIWDSEENFKRYIYTRLGKSNLVLLSKIFEIDNPKFFLILLDYFFPLKYRYIFKINLFAKKHKKIKIFIISFSIKDIFINFKGHINFLLFPLDILFLPIKFFLKLYVFIIKKILSFFKNIKNYKNENKNNLPNHSIAFWVHQTISYGNLFLKDHYYVKKKNSILNENNILHLYDTKNTINKKNFYKLSFNINNFLKLFFLHFRDIKKIIIILNKNKKLYFLYDIVYLFLRSKFYLKEVKKLNSVKKVLIDYDILAPKDLIIAFQKNKKKVFSVCERPDAVLKNSFGIISDYYFIPNSYFKRKCINNKNIIVEKNNLIISGFYRSDYLKINIKKIPEIQRVKKFKKKIVAVYGYQGAEYKKTAKSEILLNWTSCNDFLKNIINLSKNFPNFYFIIRFKNTDFLKNSYFEKTLKEIKNSSNIMISQEYKIDKYSYILARNSDYIISQYTSILEECLSFKKKVIVYNFSKNIKKNFFHHHYLNKYNFCCKNLNEIKKSLNFFFNNKKETDKIINNFCKKNYFYFKNNNTIKFITNQILKIT